MNRKPPPSYGSMASTSESEIQFVGNVSSAFNTLCDNVVTNIYTINSSLKTLDTSLKAIGTSRDNKGLRDKIHVTQLSTNQIVSVTSRELHKLAILVRKGEKQQKLQAEKLTENFKEVLARYAILQKQVADKMKANLLVTPVEYDEDATPQNVEQQKQIQLSRELAFENDMLLERELNIKKIEADILDVNEIMRELSALISQQGEDIDIIENSIEHAAGNVEEGTAELQKAASYQRKYRTKLCYLAIICIIILAILITVLVVELKK